MKNIMILGICRTGKSTFSKLIQNEINNYQIIEVDTIISALQKTIKDIPIGFIHDNLNENKLPEFLSLLIKKNNNKFGDNYGLIINADSIMPEDLVKHFDLSNTLVYYFINNELTAEDILKNCRTYDSTNEWTTRKTDEELIKHFNFYKKIEKGIMNQCKKYNIKCIDTSHNRDLIFKKLLEDVKKITDKTN